MPYDRLVLTDRADGATLATVPIVRGRTAYECFARVGQRLPTTCRGSAICGLCRVEVEEGRVEPREAAPDERALLDRVAPDEPRARLACRITPAEGEAQVVLSIDGRRWRAFPRGT